MQYVIPMKGKEIVEFIPPDLSVFRNRLIGKHPTQAFLYSTELALLDAVDIQLSIGLIKTEAKRSGKDFNPQTLFDFSEAPSLLKGIAALMEADTHLTHFECMSEKNKKLYLEHDKEWVRYTPDELRQKINEMDAFFLVQEEDKTIRTLIYQTLDYQMKEFLAKWEEHLSEAEKYGLGAGGGDPYDYPGDFCNDRSTFEYFNCFVRLRHIEHTGSLELPYFEKFVEEMEARDERFKKLVLTPYMLDTVDGTKLMNDDFDDSPWAPPDFWWEHPAPVEWKRKYGQKV